MKGILLKNTRQKNVACNDYRDPPPRVLPPVPPFSWRPKQKKDGERVCWKLKTDNNSIRELESKKLVWDTMRSMKLLKNRKYRSYAEFRDKQRELLFNMETVDDRMIRRTKVPASEYKPKELNEDGLYFASYYLTSLIKHHDNILSMAKHFTRPLRESPNTINILGEILKIMNFDMIEGAEGHLISLAFYTAQYFEKCGEEMWWLASDFYKLAKEFSYDYRDDFGYSEALINYMYGRFNLLKENDASRAVNCFERVRELSKGKHWDAEWITGVSKDHIDVYSTFLCHLALLLEAEYYRNSNLEVAMAKSEKAVELLKEGNWQDDLEGPMMDLALYSCLANHHDEAFYIVNQIEENMENEMEPTKYICVQMMFALLFLKSNRRSEALQQFLYISELGKQWNRLWMVALAYRHIAEIYMKEGKLVSAKKYASSAMLLYSRESDSSGLLHCANIYGEAESTNRIGEYVELLFSENSNNTEVSKGSESSSEESNSSSVSTITVSSDGTIQPHPCPETYRENTSNTHYLDKIIDFVSKAKPFWCTKGEKRYVVVPRKRFFVEEKDKLNATDKVYLFLKKAFGEEFAEVVKEEIETYQEKDEIDGEIENYNDTEDPLEMKYWETWTEANNYKNYLTSKYHEKNKCGEYIEFVIKERYVENERTEEEMRKPVIPYPRNSKMYKQAVKSINEYLNPIPKQNDDKLFIKYPGAKKTIKILNTVVNKDKLVILSKKPIEYEVAKEMARLDFEIMRETFDEDKMKEYEMSDLSSESEESGSLYPSDSSESIPFIFSADKGVYRSDSDSQGGYGEQPTA